MKYTDTANDQLESALSGVRNQSQQDRQPKAPIIGEVGDTIVIDPEADSMDFQSDKKVVSEYKETDLENTELFFEKAEDSTDAKNPAFAEDEDRKTVIEVTDLYKIYRVGTTKVRALNGVSFKVYEGEFCAIVGTSGSGKSTLLNMLAGLEKPTKGQIVIDGHHMEKMNENQLVRFRRENVGFIFQSFNLLGTMNAIENVALPLSFRGMPKDKRLKKAMKMLKLVGLKKHAKHKPNQMSGGQQQRVGMARALVVDPKIMFADEPTGNLDSKTSKEMMALMRKVVNEQKKTLVMVTHDDSLAAIADKVIRIVDGKIVKIEDKHTKVMEDNYNEESER